MKRATFVMLSAVMVLGAGCGSDDDSSTSGDTGPTTTQATTTTSSLADGRVVKVEGDRGLFVRCSGKGSPTVVFETGDGDTADQYDFAVPDVARETRACVYERAGLGRSDPPPPGARGLKDLTGDLERLLEAASIPGPYVLVGASGGGYIIAGYAFEHRRDIAGMLFVDTAAPFPNPPKEVVEETAPDSPNNLERRDFLQVENDAWQARRRIGDIPVTVMSARPPTAELREAPPAERKGLRRNVRSQRGWLVLSPQAKQIVVRGGHSIDEERPDLVIDAILDVVKASR